VEQEVFEFDLTFFRPTFFRLNILGSPHPGYLRGRVMGPDWPFTNVRLRFSLLIDSNLGEGLIDIRPRLEMSRGVLVLRATAASAASGWEAAARPPGHFLRESDSKRNTHG